MTGKNIYVTTICPGPVKTQLDVSALTGAGEPQGKRELIIQKNCISADRLVFVAGVDIGFNCQLLLQKFNSFPAKF